MIPILTGIPPISFLMPLSESNIPAIGKPGIVSKIYGSMSDSEKIKELLKRKNPLKWLFTGDSITAGVKHTHGYRSYSEIFAERIRWEMDRRRDVIINTAISGNITQNILEDFNWRVEQFEPDIVSLMIGTNDCTRKEITKKIFKLKLDELLNKIKATGAIPILHTPNAIIKKYASERADLFEYVKVTQKAAEKKNIILVDNYSYWEGIMKNQPDMDFLENWLDDPVHPNQIGHREIAFLMFKKLSIFDSKSPSCTSYVG